MTVNTGEVRRDTETMKDRNIITGEVRIEMMKDKTTITGEVKKGTEMMKDKKITRGEVRIDTEMMIDKPTTSDGVERGTGKVIDKTTVETKREMVRGPREREEPTTLTTNFPDQRRTPRISIPVTTPLR